MEKNSSGEDIASTKAWTPEKSFANRRDCRWLSARNCWEKEWGVQPTRAMLLEGGNTLKFLEWLFPLSVRYIEFS